MKNPSSRIGGKKIVTTMTNMISMMLPFDQVQLP
jgi:hypothetical protein